MPVSQVPSLLEVTEAQPESQVPTASMALSSSVRNQGTGCVSSVLCDFFS